MISNTISSIPTGSILLDQELDIVHCVKFVGLMLDDKIKFNKLIQYICGKISKSIGILFRIRSFVPVSLLRNIYFSLIHPYYLYCLPVFGSAYGTHLEPLRVLQRRAIRLIGNTDLHDDLNPLFYTYDILKFDDLYKHSLGCFIYNVQDLLSSYVHSHSYYTRN